MPVVSRKTASMARNILLALTRVTRRKHRERVESYRRCYGRLVSSLLDGMPEQIESMRSGVCPYCGRKFRNVKKHLNLNWQCSRSLDEDVRRVLEEVWAQRLALSLRRR